MESGRIRYGISAGDIVAIVFSMLGAAFTAIGAVLALYPHALQEAHPGDAAVVVTVFCCIGIPFLLAGIAVAAVSVGRRIAIKRVVDAGDYVLADVMDIRPNYSVRVNGRCPYELECHYRDPQTGELHVFRSRNLFFYPGELAGKQVRVYVDLDRMKRYYVDVEGFVSDVQVH